MPYLYLKQENLPCLAVDREKTYHRPIAGQRLSIALLFYLSIYLVPSQLTTDIQMSSSIPHLNVTEATRGVDECKSINKLIGLN